VLKSVETDCPTARLPHSNFLPKTFVLLADPQARVSIVRNHCENRSYAGVHENSFHRAPDGPIHGWTKIVEAKQILALHFASLVSETSGMPRRATLTEVCCQPRLASVCFFTKRTRSTRSDE